MSLLFVLVIFVSCGSKTGGINGGGPVDPPPSAMPKINSFTPTNDTVTINYTGMPNNGSVDFSWITVNGSTTFNGSGVSATGSQSISKVLVTGDYTLKVTNGTLTPAESTRRVIVNIDPLFKKMSGATGQRWKIVRSTSVRLSDGNLLELLQPYEEDNRYTIYPYGRWYVDFGANNPSGTASYEEDIQFNASTSEIAIQDYRVQPLRAVKLFADPTVMEWSYTKNGKLYTEYYKMD